MMDSVFSDVWLPLVRVLAIAVLAGVLMRGIVRSRVTRWRRVGSCLLLGVGALAAATYRGVHFFDAKVVDVLTLRMPYQNNINELPMMDLPLVVGYALILGALLALPFQATGRFDDLKQDVRERFLSARATHSYLRWLAIVALSLIAYFLVIYLPYYFSNR